MQGDFENIQFVQAKHFKKGRRYPCKYIVIHYTAQGLIHDTVHFFSKPNPAKASSHFIVGRKPKLSGWLEQGVVQMVKLSDTAYHAGKSYWKGYHGINHHSIGLELCNYGPLIDTEKGLFTWDGKEYPLNLPEPVYCDHKFYEPFTDFQYKTAAKLCAFSMKIFPHITKKTLQINFQLFEYLHVISTGLIFDQLG